MKQSLENFAKKKVTLWALSMSFVSSLCLFILFLLSLVQSNDNYVVANPTLTIIMLFIGFILCGVYFKIFTFFKKFTFWAYLTINLLFLTIFISLLIFCSNHLHELDTHINFISVKEWSEDGYAPSEEVLSTSFCFLILIVLNFITIFLLNIIPNGNDKSKR